MRNKFKRFLFFALGVLLLSAVILSLIGSDRIAGYVISKVKETLTSKFKVGLFYTKSGFSYTRGVFLEDFIITDSREVVVMKGREARIDLSFLSSRRELIISRLLVTGGELFMDDKGNVPAVDLTQFYRYIRHLLLTDFTVVCSLKERTFRLHSCFLEVFFSKERWEGQVRLTDSSGNKVKALFTGPGNWGLDGEFELNDVSLLSDQSLFHLFDARIVMHRGHANGKFNGFLADLIDKNRWNLELHVSGADASIFGNEFRELTGEVGITPTGLNFDLDGKYCYSQLRIKGIQKEKDFLFKVTSPRINLADFQAFFPDNLTTTLKGLGRCEVEVKSTGGKIKEFSGRLSLDAGEIYSNMLENMELAFSYKEGKLSLAKSSFLLSRAWEILLSGEVSVTPAAGADLTFRAQNSSFNFLSLDGTVKGKAGKFLLESDLLLGAEHFPFQLDLNSLPRFKGAVKSRCLTAVWSGESLPGKGISVRSDYTLALPVFTEPLSGGLNFKTLGLDLEIGRSTVNNRFGKGELSGQLGLSGNHLNFSWAGKCDLIRYLKDLGFGGMAEISGEAYGNLSNPQVSAEVRIPDYGIVAKAQVSRDSVEIDGKIETAEFNGQYEMKRSEWGMNFRMNDYVIIAPMLRDIFQRYGITADRIKGLITMKGRQSKIGDVDFKIVLKDGKFKGQGFRELTLSGKGDEQSTTLASFEALLPDGGSIKNLGQIIIRNDTGLRSMGLKFENARLSFEKFSFTTDGVLAFSTDLATGEVSLRLSDVKYGGNSAGSFILSGRIAKGDVLVDDFGSDNPVFSGWKGNLKISLSKDKFWLRGIKLKNQNFTLQGELCLQNDLTLEDFTLSLSDRQLDKEWVSLKMAGDSLSGSFDLDCGYLKKITSFDKLPGIVLKGNLMQNHGQLEFATDYNGESIKGTSSFYLTHEKTGWHLTGEAELDDCKIVLKTGEDVNLDRVNLSPLRFKLELRAGQNVWVKNQFFNIEVSGSFFLTGEDYPGITASGDVKLVRGTVNYFNHRFDIVTGKAYYQTLAKSKEDGSKREKVIDLKQRDKPFDAKYKYLDPEHDLKGKEHEIVLSRNESFIEGDTNLFLNLTAYKKIQGNDVYLSVNGPLSNLQVSAYSTNEMEKDKLQKMITGSTLGSLGDDQWSDSRFREALKFNLSEQLMGKVGDNIAKELELEEFDIESGSEKFNPESLDLRLGKSLNDRVYLRYYKAIRRYEEDQQFELKYKTNKHLYLDGIYDDYKQEYRYGLNYSISF
ncbi:MAG: translocation/assembly module TamB domain-containing protein [Candidatus Wallbacteria bacterium]|nr:translocation/assembly module TamB domain-containing protein [Candidatus Wallbacteria bacterium]